MPTFFGYIVPSIKCPGQIFSDKLNCSPHLRYLNNKCCKKSYLLKVIANHKWDADKETLHIFYQTTIRVKIYYGSIIYTTAKPSILKIYNPIYNQGVRISTGAFRSSPANSLLIEAGEPNVYQRRTNLVFNYINNIARNPEPINCKTIYQNSPTISPSLTSNSANNSK